MASEMTLRYEGGLRYEATRAKTGRTIHTDVDGEHGGQDDYFSPVELAVASLASCVASVMAIVAERSGVDLSNTKIQVQWKMASSPIHRIDSIQMEINLPNWQTVSEAVRRKIQTAINACPVKNSLHPDTHVTVEFA